MKIYITFGQQHIHKIGNKVLDKDTVACIECETQEEGRKRAFELFGDKFFTDYPLEIIRNSMYLFPKGIVNID